MSKKDLKMKLKSIFKRSIFFNAAHETACRVNLESFVIIGERL